MMYGKNKWDAFVRGWRHIALSGKMRDPLWNYFTDIHPKTEGQYRDQKFFAGWNSYYSNWMQSRSQDERNYNTRQQYGIDWSDIDYPWLSGISGGNTAQALGSFAGWQFSKNISRLYR